MIAYNPIGVNNLYYREQATEGFHYNCLTRAELESIHASYPVNFYSPHFFIRIGLFLLTTVILFFSFGLFSLLFIDSIDHTIGGLAIFFALLAYAALEYMVQTKGHFQSGVDDALGWISACSLFGGISYLTDAGALANSGYIFFISLYFTLRFADRVMAIAGYVSLLCIFFFSIIKLGAAAKTFFPFVLMAISAIIYLWEKRIKRFKINHLYSNCLKIISIAALLGFYFSVNYYVARELSIAWLNLNLAERGYMPTGWLCWLFTVVIPIVYFGRGIQKKDIVLIRVGMLLMAATILTVKYYYPFVSPEVSMTVAGIVLMLVSFGLTRYLQFPKYGFTNLEIASEDEDGKLQVESLLQAETLSGQPAPGVGTRFGGGGFGGGGASGEF